MVEWGKNRGAREGTVQLRTSERKSFEQNEVKEFAPGGRTGVQVREKEGNARTSRKRPFFRNVSVLVSL